MSPTTQALHWSLLRMAKGMLRAWEVWLRIETGSDVVTFAPRKDAQDTPTPTA